MKKGTTAGTAASFKAKSTTSHHGPAVKNLQPNAHRVGKPSSGGRTAPLKGSDRGGV